MAKSVLETFSLQAADGMREGAAAPVWILRCPNRLMCSLLTAGFFVCLWLIGAALGWFVPVAAVLAYGFFIAPRWDAFGIGIGLPFFLMSAYAAFFFLSRDGVPLLAHFVILTVAVFPCIAPLSIGLLKWHPRRGVGRTGFILFAMPYFFIAGAQYWAGLNRVLSEVGSLVWFGINSVPAGAVIYAAMAPMFVMGSRGLAMGHPRAAKWASIAFILIVLLRLFGANSVTVLRDFVWLFDLGAVALLLLFCFWPSKSEPQMAQSQ